MKSISKQKFLPPFVRDPALTCVDLAWSLGTLGTTFAMAVSEMFEQVLQQVLRDYDSTMQLRPNQKAAFERLWIGATDVIVSLPMGYGKSVISHLCGRILRAKNGQPENGITVVVVPLNMIQYDQVASLAKHGITACKMDIEGNTSCATNEDEAYDKVTIMGEFKYFLLEWLFTQPIKSAV